jgi:AraC-like DNA-binding protein
MRLDHVGRLSGHEGAKARRFSFDWIFFVSLVPSWRAGVRRDLHVMLYREYAPSPHLAPVIDRFWTLEGHACDLSADLQPVLPDGRSEVILHFGDPFERVEPDGVATRQPAIMFAGQLTARLVLRPTGRVAVLGVRFHADGAPAIIAAPQDDLAGRTIAIESVSAALARELTRVRDVVGSPSEAVSAVEDRLTRLLRPDRLDVRVRAVVNAIRQRRGRVSIDALATRAGVTRRHLERRFGQLVGVSPKRLARIARFQHALGLLERPLERDDATRRGTIAAVECGYADQAHFIRDFRDLAGCPPGEHLLRHAELTGFFVERRTPVRL